MRRCLYIFLILLLPLRGWVGDAMAMQMAVPAPVQQQRSVDAAIPIAHSHATQHAPVPAHGHGTAAPVWAGAADCTQHDAAQSTDQADHCETCTMCQTCHTVAVLHVVAVPDHGRFPLPAPQYAAEGFTSADRALALKPPTA